MPRGVKKIINYDEEIEHIDMRIEKYKKELAELNERRQELVNTKRQNEVSALYEALQHSGMSVSDALTALGLNSDQSAKTAS